MVEKKHDYIHKKKAHILIEDLILLFTSRCYASQIFYL